MRLRAGAGSFAATVATAAALTAALVGCQSVHTTQPGTVGVDRSQTMLVSSGQINSSARKAYSQTLQQAAQKGQLNRDAAQLARVREVAARLIAQTGAFRPDAPRWEWEVNVITSKEVNAWCMPGGKIAVYTGILDGLKLTDEELAAVMGHEISHALREHGRERASQAMTQGLLINVVGAAAGLSGLTQDLSKVVLNLTFNLPNSRQDEVEADRMGVELAARAGYDPRAAVTLWQKMGAKSASGSPQFLSTHPANETRIADLRVISERVLPLYDKARSVP
jgi:predicted Zn-dependent protease